MLSLLSLSRSRWRIAWRWRDGRLSAVIRKLQVFREQVIGQPQRVELVRSCGDSIMKDKVARNLIRSREIRLKGGRSRFTNPRALDQWTGAAGLSRMNYRWPTVTRFIRDLHDGLDGK